MDGGRRKDSASFPPTIRHFSGRQDGSFCTPLRPPACQETVGTWSQSILPRIRKFWTCNAQCRSYGGVRFTHDGKACFMLSMTRTLKTSGCSRSMVRRESRSRNFKSEQITDFHWSFDGSKLGTASRAHRFRCCTAAGVQTVGRVWRELGFFDPFFRSMFFDPWRDRRDAGAAIRSAVIDCRCKFPDQFRFACPPFGVSQAVDSRRLS